LLSGRQHLADRRLYVQQVKKWQMVGGKTATAIISRFFRGRTMVISLVSDRHARVHVLKKRRLQTIL
jgi:hypothetical protein